jgi:hypothetical protein
MRILSFIAATLLLVLKDGLISAIISAFFCLLKWLGSLMSICSSPTWSNFLWGGLGVFALFFIPHMIKMSINFINGE